jgi:hypothetical protein
MNKLLDEQIHELLRRSNGRAFGERERARALRVAAATLWRGLSDAITATTVVCDVADGQLDAVVTLVADIAEEYGVDASVQQQQGCCSVRFRPLPPRREHRSADPQ